MACHSKFELSRFSKFELSYCFVLFILFIIALWAYPDIFLILMDTGLLLHHRIQ